MYLIDWEFFIEKFREKYVNPMFIEQMKKDFLYLKQGRISILEYEHEFMWLNRYAKGMFLSEKDICDKFE